MPQKRGAGEAKKRPQEHMDTKNSIVAEAARIFCEERLTDYHSAKLKAAQRLGLGAKAALPDNAQVQAAVLEYLQLFGGREYHEHLARMRAAAIRAMQLLAEFSPRLAGAAVSGAAHSAHRVQLHAVCDKAEMLEIFLHDRSIRCEQDERTYRYPRGREQRVPLVCFDAGGIGVDVAVFTGDQMRSVPLNPADGLSYRRLDLAELEALIGV